MEAAVRVEPEEDALCGGGGDEGVVHGAGPVAGLGVDGAVVEAHPVGFPGAVGFGPDFADVGQGFGGAVQEGEAFFCADDDFGGCAFDVGGGAGVEGWVVRIGGLLEERVDGLGTYLPYWRAEIVSL